jgi:hypothetical protein
MPDLFTESARVVAWERTSHIFPGQWEGTLADGRHIYIRYRYSAMGFGIGATLDEAVRNFRRDVARPMRPADSFLADSEMIALMRECGVSLENAERRGAPCEDF